MRARIVTGLVVTALLGTACSGGGGAVGLGTGEGYSVMGALAELPGPATPEAMVQTGDLTAASEVAGLERPATLDTSAMAEWVSSLSGGPVGAAEPAPVFVPFAEVFNIQWLTEHQQFADALGWSLLDVDSFAEVLLPPERFAVVAGDFDEATLLTDLPEVAEGVVTYGEGEDHAADLENANAVNRLGIPVRLGHRDGVVAASPSTEAVADWVAGPEVTLAEDTALAAVAGALDEQDVVAAVLTTGQNLSGDLAVAEMSMTPEVVESLRQQLTDLPSVSFGTVGIGWAVQDDEPVVVVAYHMGSEDAAERAVPQFETTYRQGVTLRTGQPLSDWVELLSVEAAGDVVVVRGRNGEVGRPGALLEHLYGRDVPFLHQ